MAQLKDTIIQGSARITDSLYSDTIKANLIIPATIQAQKILALTSSAANSELGPGTNGQVLKSNGANVYWATDLNVITGVKGNAETSYRTGSVNLTPANIGAVAKSGDTMTGILHLNAGNTGLSNSANIKIDWLNTTTQTQVAYITASSDGKFGINALTDIYLRPGNGTEMTTSSVGPILVTLEGIYPQNSASTQTIGTSTYRFNNIYSVDGNFSGNLLAGYAGINTAIDTNYRLQVTGGKTKLEYSTPLVLANSTTTTSNTPITLQFSITDTDLNVTNNSSMIRVYSSHNSANSGSSMVVQSGAMLFLGGGEAADQVYRSIYATSPTSETENLYCVADKYVYIEANANGTSAPNRVGIVINAGGSIIPVLVEQYNPGAQNLGASNSTWQNLYLSTPDNAQSGTGIDFYNNVTVDGTTTTTKCGHIGTNKNGLMGIYGSSKIVLRSSLSTATTGLEIEGNTVTIKDNLNTNMIRTKDGKWFAIPSGGVYNYATDATITGALQIILPVAATNTMINFDVQIYTYADVNAPAIQGTYHINGYTYSSNTYGFHESKGRSVYFDGIGRVDQVHFGKTDSDAKPCIIIGDINSTWRIPHVTITNVQLGFKGMSNVGWYDDWDIAFVTTLPTALINDSKFTADKVKIQNLSVDYAINAGNAAQLTDHTLWGKTFNGTQNVSGDLTSAGPNIKLPAGQTQFQFKTSTNSAAQGMFGKLGLYTTYANADLDTYTLDVQGVSRFTDKITINNATPVYAFSVSGTEQASIEYNSTNHVMNFIVT